MSTGRAKPAFRYIQEVTGTLDNQNVADRELLARFVNGSDEAAFATLVRRHGRMVLGVCLRVLRSREDAEDAFQATFLALFRTASSLRPRESIGGWLYSVAYRVAQKTRVAAARRRKHEEKVADRQTADRVDQLTVREASEILDEELVRLPDKLRIPLVLCYLEGLSRDEAAERLGWQTGTLKSRLEQARERLASRLAARGLTLPSTLVALLFSGEAASAAVAPALIDSTISVAAAFVAGQAASAVSARVIALSEGARTMFATKLKIATAALIGSAAIGIWASVGFCLSANDPPVLGKGTPAAGKTAASPAPKVAATVDLTKIDRTIKKEPTYKYKTPKYCLLVFGPDAKTRVWLVHDGTDLYVDKNGNGDLAEVDKRVGATSGFVPEQNKAKFPFLVPLKDAQDSGDRILYVHAPFKVGTITEQNGTAKHKLWVGYNETKDLYTVYADVDVNAEEDGKYLQMTDPGFGLGFGDSPKNAPVVYLNGQLAVHRWPHGPEKSISLVRGDKENLLAIRIGTDGIGKGSEAWLNPFKGIPDDIHPTADIEFQNKEPGGKPINLQIPLTTRAWGMNSLFYAPVSIPNEATDGKAKVTVNFDDWKARRVAPATFEATVETPKKDVKP